MSEKPQPCRHKRPFCLECHGSEFQGGVSVKRTAIEYLKRNHPSACERAGLCETIGGRQYTVTLSCHGYVLAADYEALQAEYESLRKASSELAKWCFHVVGVDIEHAPGLKQIVDITRVVYDEEDSK